MMNELNDSVPMYQQISSIIERQISEGVYKEGEKIPTEIQLMEQFGVSRTTVRLAIKEITKSNLVKKIPGKGTFVNKVFHNLEEFKLLYESLIDVGVIPERELLEFEKVQATPEIQQSLELEENAKVLRIIRLLHVNKRPIAMVEITLHPELVDAINKDEARKHPVYQFLSDKKGLRFIQSDLEIFSENASKDVARVLQINENDAVIGTKRILYTDNDEPIEHVLLRFRSDAFRFRVTLQGELGLQVTERGRLSLVEKSDSMGKKVR